MKPQKLFQPIIVITFLTSMSIAYASETTPPSNTKKQATQVKLDNQNCSTWFTGDEIPANYKVKWSGDCVNGFAQGFGIEESTHRDGSTVYVGHVHQGLWHGLGRLTYRDADKRLLQVVEVTHQKDEKQGIATTLLNQQHPNAKETIEFLNQKKVGFTLGDNYLKFMEFYQDDEALSACNMETMCMLGAKNEGATLIPATDLGAGMNLPMSLGGWKIQVKTMRQKQEQEPVDEPGQVLNFCLTPSEMRAPARTGDVLFPSLNVWTPYLNANYDCQDTLLVWDGQYVKSKALCTSAESPEIAEIAQQRIANGTGFAIVFEETARLNGKVTETIVKSIVGTHQAACDPQALPASNLKF